MLHQAPTYAVSNFPYEHFIWGLESEIKRNCALSGVPSWETLLNFKEPFTLSSIFSSDRDRTVQLEVIPSGLFTAVEASSSVGLDVLYHGLLSNTEKDTLVEEQLGRIYVSCWERDILRLRTIIAEKAWVGFDLDDTLHEFRRSSGTATRFF